MSCMEFGHFIRGFVIRLRFEGNDETIAIFCRTASPAISKHKPLLISTCQINCDMTSFLSVLENYGMMD